MTLTELRYIVTLAQEQHFGRAAERCHVSQPTLSVGVKKLEDELGVLIFERSKSAVRLTPVGEGIVAQAQKVLEQAQGIRELAQAGKNQLAAPLRVGAIYTVGPYLFPHLIPQLHRIAPDMPLYIEENFTHVLRDKLRTGELDAIIIALPFQEADVLTKPLYDEPFYVVMPADHPWTNLASVDGAMLNDKSLLLLGEGHCFRDQVLEACPTTRKGSEAHQHTTVESSSLETIRHMVASGLGVSVLPFTAVDSHHYAPGVLAIRPLTPPVPHRTVAIAWRASFPRPKAIDVLVDAVRLCSVTHPPHAAGAPEALQPA
jgi:LysR family hydrogen peroxide-inducible transcriptional activator